MLKVMNILKKVVLPISVIFCSVSYSQWTDNGNLLQTNDDVYVPGASIEGPGKYSIYGYRGGSSGETNGGTSWSQAGVDAAMKGYSYWGNNYTAGLAAHSYLDYKLSSALVAARYNGNYAAKLAYKDENSKIWSGHFDGDVKVTGKLIIGTGNDEWTIESVPDYVFAPDYDLPSLDTVEQFVKENRHLPEIPSEKEIKAEGINLVDMNLKLLKKVEELTLYIINQDKRINSLEKGEHK